MPRKVKTIKVSGKEPKIGQMVAVINEKNKVAVGTLVTKNEIEYRLGDVQTVFRLIGPVVK